MIIILVVTRIIGGRWTQVISMPWWFTQTQWESHYQPRGTLIYLYCYLRYWEVLGQIPEQISPFKSEICFSCKIASYSGIYVIFWKNWFCHMNEFNSWGASYSFPQLPGCLSLKSGRFRAFERCKCGAGGGKDVFCQCPGRAWDGNSCDLPGEEVGRKIGK